MTTILDPQGDYSVFPGISTLLMTGLHENRFRSKLEKCFQVFTCTSVVQSEAGKLI